MVRLSYIDAVELDGPALQSLARSARRQLRQRMQALRAAIPAAARARRDAAVVERLLALPEVTRARSIALFSAMPEKAELDVRALDVHERTRGHAVAYPRLASTAEAGIFGDLASTRSLADLSPSRLGFLEPAAEVTAAAAGDVDVVIVPALAASATGHRLGYGAGFYDRVLPAYRPPAIAVVVVYDFQLLAELPILDHDVPCDIVVTDSRTLRITDTARDEPE
jgi:5-formyltetrahydrofolate cyclo-ligase